MPAKSGLLIFLQVLQLLPSFSSFGSPLEQQFQEQLQILFLQPSSVSSFTVSFFSVGLRPKFQLNL